MTTTLPATSVDDLRQAIHLVRQAGRLAADAFDAPGRDLRRKPDGSELTPTDLAIEDLLREQLHRHYPHDGVIGEERPPRTGTSGRRWIIDPISGTGDFVHRVPLYSVDLALEDRQGPALAVSGLPASRLVMAAGRGLGCWLLTGEQDLRQARRATVSDRADLAGAVVCTHGLSAWPTELVSRLHARCRLRDGVHSIPRLITGRADAVLVSGTPLGYEDLACLPALVEESGGRVTDTSGRPVLDGDGTVLATNGVLHADLLALLAGLR
ncbi:MAG: inositol monophosphatase family protein [Labedaea sp.]